MKEIPLTKGLVALVDDEDYERVAARRWHCCGTKHVYAATAKYQPATRKNSTILLHRFVMNAPDGVMVDHRDRNTLNCQKANLRFCTRSQNNANRALHTNNTSGYRGVIWHKKQRTWVAQIKQNGKHIQLGAFGDPVAAARAYDAGALKHYGEFASLNFPNEQRVRAEIEAAGGTYHVIQSVDDLYSVLGVI